MEEKEEDDDDEEEEDVDPILKGHFETRGNKVKRRSSYAASAVMSNWQVWLESMPRNTTGHVFQSEFA